MTIEIRTSVPEDFDGLIRGLASSFGDHPRDDWAEQDRHLMEWERTFVAFDGGVAVGGAGTASLELTVPGALVPMAAVTMVGVAPTHRRRGIARELMRRQLDHIRDLGREAVAGLWSAESSIYGRFGYGIATWDCRFEIERHRAELAVPLGVGGQVRLLDKPEGLKAFRPIYERIREGRPGMLGFPDAFHDARFSDFEADRDGASALFYAVHEGPQGDDAYAAYRVKSDWQGGHAASRVLVPETMSTSPDGAAAIWRYLFGLDLTAWIEVDHRPPDDPLMFMLAEPRRLRPTIGDGLWLRLIDAPRALEQRRYPAEGTLVLEVRDEFCPWVQGRFELVAGPDGAACRPTERAAELTLSAGDLGSALLGGVRLRQMADAGRIDEERPGAVETADRMFAGEWAPWSPRIF